MKASFTLTTSEGGKFVPDTWQKEVLNSTAHTRICVNGRQTGKTTLLLADMMNTAYATPGGESMLCVSVYKILDPILTKLFRMVPDFAIKHWNKQQGILTIGQPIVDDDGQIIETKTIHTIWLRSADRPDTLRGPTLHSLYVDEATVIQNPTVWHEVLEPMLAMERQAGTGGRALITGTPKGTAAWVYDLWKRGQDPTHPNLESWKVTAYDCPRYTEEYLQEKRDSMTEASFAQEYMAEWINAEGRLFRADSIEACTKGALQEPQSGRKYIIGADFARKIDYSVFIVMDITSNKVVAFQRMKQLPYPVIEERLAKLAKRYNNALVCYDATQRSEELLRSLRQRGLHRLMPVAFTSKSKPAMMEMLAIAIEKGTISFPKIDFLLRELEVFRVKKTPHGNMKFEAPPGHHDDGIDALALCVYGKRRALRKACGRNSGMSRIMRPRQSLSSAFGTV